MNPARGPDGAVDLTDLAVPPVDRHGSGRERWAQEQGAGTVYVTGIVAMITALGVVMGGLIQAQAASGSARATADMAALSGAQAVSSLLSGAQPCAVAGSVAQANGARLESCAVTGQDVTVCVAVPARVLGLRRVARAWARAGPVETDGMDMLGGMDRAVGRDAQGGP